MRRKVARALAALVLVCAAFGVGYSLGSEGAPLSRVVGAPPADSVRILYSLDEKQNDKELIALIEGAQKYIYFAIYTFTLPGVADALVAAKKRGIAVYGVIDSGQAASGYGIPIVEKLLYAGIPLVVEKHESGGGIMHIKALVTDRAYAFGSYNWTNSATTINDEILEIGTDPTLRKVHEDFLKRLYERYKGNSAAAAVAVPPSAGVIDYTEAPAHVGEYADVRGTRIKTHETASGTVFLDFCTNYKTCPFTGVIFADDVEEFGDLSRYEGKTVVLSGKIQLYQGRAEIILSDPSQLSF